MDSCDVLTPPPPQHHAIVGDKVLGKEQHQIHEAYVRMCACRGAQQCARSSRGRESGRAAARPYRTRPVVGMIPPA